MDLKKVEVLLERYWNCASTTEEERELREFFSLEHIPDKYKHVAALFRYYSDRGKPGIPDPQFEPSLIERLKHQKSPKVRKMERAFQNYMKVAAALLLIVVTSLIFRMEVWKSGNAPDLLLVQDTYKSPEQAFAETKKALLLIASKMKEGKQQVDRIKALNEAEQKIKTQKK